MMSMEKVLSVEYSGYPHNCIVIRYQQEEGDIAFAAVAENLSVKEGDLVWVLHNDRLDYKCYGAVAVLHV